MIIKPYTDVTGRTDIAETFPCCKMFFKMAETSGNSITESVSGSAVATGLTLNYSVANAVTLLAGAGASNLALPATIAVGALSALRLTVCNLATLASHALGTSGSARMSLISSQVSVSDGTNTAAPVFSPTNGAIVGIGNNFVSGTTNEGTVRQATLTTLTGPTSATATPGDLTNLGNITQIVSFGATIGNYSCYGDALFVFAAGLPSDVSAAVAWMTARWQLGYKEIYPGWKNLA